MLVIARNRQCNENDMDKPRLIFEDVTFNQVNVTNIVSYTSTSIGTLNNHNLTSIVFYSTTFKRS